MDPHPLLNVLARFGHFSLLRCSPTSTYFPMAAVTCDAPQRALDAQRFDKRAIAPLVSQSTLDSYPKTSVERLDVMDGQRFDPSQRSASPKGAIILLKPDARTSFLDIPEDAFDLVGVRLVNAAKHSYPETAVELHDRLEIRGLTRKLEDIRLEVMDSQRFDVSRRQSPTSSTSNATSSDLPADNMVSRRGVSTYTTDTVFWDWVRFAREGTESKHGSKFWDWIETVRGDSTTSSNDNGASNSSGSLNSMPATSSGFDADIEDNDTALATSIEDSGSIQFCTQGFSDTAETAAGEFESPGPAPVVIFSNDNMRVIEHPDKGTLISISTVVRPGRRSRRAEGPTISRPTSPLRKILHLNCLRQDDAFFDDARRVEKELKKKEAEEKGVVVWVTRPAQDEELNEEWRNAIRAVYYQGDDERMRKEFPAAYDESGPRPQLSAIPL
ncbi:hypothetical protein D9758_006680 [Tetrapyrgos nigripes]|uniref:Uncharacterized protein n=1 Tax=Tetrapyrgos nigripes TaxID=182062 RepID=A0A8H5GJK0_9AGAR|nr:hypothetical protein D9758_006680 [Tetrapyrgos nigripes]